jgi:integrase
MSRFKNTKFPGIRTDSTGKYHSTKSINGKRFYKTFTNLRDAKYWMINFHPIINPSPTRSNPIVSKSGFKNGSNSKINLLELYEKYKAQAMHLLSEETQYKKDLCIRNFIKGVEHIKICQINPEVIGDILTEKKKTSFLSPQRISYERDLKELSSIFNWYIEAVDFSFINPIRRIHKKMSVIDSEVKEKKDFFLTIEEFIHLQNSFTGKMELYKDICAMQFYTNSRISETLAIKRENIHLGSRKILMDSKLVFPKDGNIKNKPSNDIKHINKEVYINDAMFEIVTRWLNKPSSDIETLFLRDGNYIRYNSVQININKALKLAGLNFSGTHIFRKGMTNVATNICGLDYGQSFANHKNRKTTEKFYTELNKSRYTLNRHASIEVEKIVDEVKSAYKCVQGDVVMLKKGSIK